MSEILWFEMFDYMQIYNEIEKHKPFDRIFLEFGRIKLIYSAQATSSNFVFDEKYEKSNKMVVRTDVSFFVFFWINVSLFIYICRHLFTSEHQNSDCQRRLKNSEFFFTINYFVEIKDDKKAKSSGVLIFGS